MKFRGLVIVWALLSVGALVAALCTLHIDLATTEEAGRANLARLWPFWLSSGSLWAALTALWLLIARDDTAASSSLAGRRGATWLILLVAVAARATVLVGHDPSLSDDVYRYVFDGRNLAAGVNPYLVVPEDRIGTAAPRWPGEPEVARRVNNPELHTIYLPTSQWAFAAIATIMPGDVDDPDVAARWYRAALTVVELLTIGLLLATLSRAGRCVWWVTLYAWHPLAITEIAGSGHQEPLGMLLLVVALSARTTRLLGWTTALAAGGLVKPVVVPVAGLILRRERWSRWLLCAAVGVLVCVVIGAPLLLATDGEGVRAIENLRATATRFSLKWAHFGSVYEPLLWSIEQVMPGPNDPQERMARAICTAALAIAIGLILVRRPAPWKGAAAMVLAMVLLAPAVHPWYLLWALVLMPMAPSPAVWAASLTLTWGYAAWGYRFDDEGQLGWGVSPWVMVAAYAPVYGALIWGSWKRKGSPTK